MLEMLVYLVLAYSLLGLTAITIMLELESVKRNKKARAESWKGWSLDD